MLVPDDGAEHLHSTTPATGGAGMIRITDQGEEREATVAPRPPRDERRGTAGGRGRGRNGRTLCGSMSAGSDRRETETERWARNLCTSSACGGGSHTSTHRGAGAKEGPER